MPPGLVSETLAPCEVVGGELVLARLGDEVVERVEEVLEGEPAGVADDRHHQRAPAVLLLDVDGDAEVDLAVVDADGLPSTSSKWCAMTGICSVAARAIA